MSESPVFVAGLPRTGKTALRMALGGHPLLSMTRKTRLWTSFYGKFGDLGDPRALEQCMQAMLSDPGVARLIPDEMSIREEFAAGPPTYARLFGAFHGQYARRMGKSRWGEQMAGLEAYAGPIFATWPDARVVHMVRHPAEWIEARSQLRPGGVGAALSRWTASARRALQSQAEWPDAYLVVTTEMLIAQPAVTLRQVSSFIGVESNFGIGQILVDALPARLPSALGSTARRYVHDRAGDMVVALGYPSPPGEEGSGPFDDAAAIWFGLGRDVGPVQAVAP